MIKGFKKSRILPLGSRIVKNKNFTWTRNDDFFYLDSFKGFNVRFELIKMKSSIQIHIKKIKKLYAIDPKLLIKPFATSMFLKSVNYDNMTVVNPSE